MKNIIKTPSTKGMFIPLCFALVMTFGCKKDSSNPDPLPDAKTSSSITVIFKGKTFIIPYLPSLENIDGGTSSGDIFVGNATITESNVFFTGSSKDLEVYFSGNKRGEPVGIYNSGEYKYTYQDGSFNVHEFGAGGTITDLTDGSKDWYDSGKNSTITVTKSDALKLEGTFSIDLTYGNTTQKATGSFNIYK